MVENYLEYLLLYESELETHLSEKDYIRGFLLYWQSANLPPSKWCEWVRDNKSVFVETGADKELMMEFNSFIIFCQKKYMVDCESDCTGSDWIGLFVEKLSEFKMKLFEFAHSFRDDMGSIFSKDE